MEIFHGKQEAGKVEAGHWGSAYAYFAQKIEEISPLNVVQQKINEVTVLGTVYQFNQ